MATPREQNHQLGHRDRLRRRVKAGGFEPLPDYELLRLILLRTSPRGDAKLLAKTLLKRFGSIAGVFGASLAELCSIKRVGEATAIDIRGAGRDPSDRPRSGGKAHGDFVLVGPAGLRPRRAGQ